MGRLDGGQIFTLTGTPFDTEASQATPEGPASFVRSRRKDCGGTMGDEAAERAALRREAKPAARPTAAATGSASAASQQPLDSSLLQLIELSGGGIWACDAAFRLIEVSPQMAGLLADLGGGGLGTPLTDVFRLVSAPLLGDLAATLGDVMAGGVRDTLVVSGRRGAGRELFLEMPICPAGQGSVGRLYGLLRPFDLRGEREALVGRLMTAVDSFEAPLALTRGDGRIAYANIGFLALVGFAGQDVIDHPIDDFVDVGTVRGAATEGGSVRCRLHGSDGGSTPCMMAATALPLDSAGPAARLCAFVPAQPMRHQTSAPNGADRAAGRAAEALGMIAQLMHGPGEPALPGSLRFVLGRRATDSLPDVLTARQRQIAAEIMAGRSTREIAVSLALSVETVRTHQKQLYRRLGVRGRSDLLLQFAGAPHGS